MDFLELFRAYNLIALFGNINLLPNLFSLGELKSISDSPTNLYSIVQ